MRIAVPIAAYENGTTGEYCKRAFQKLGHEAETMSQYDMFRELPTDHFDLFFCVDSGGPMNLFMIDLDKMQLLNKVAFWMIDYRRGKDIKDPNDFKICDLINRMGGWVFQAQYEDMVDCLNRKLGRVSWLPLGADADVWSDKGDTNKTYDVGFVGNVWDNVRGQILEGISNAGLKCSFQGHGSAYMEIGAELLRHSKVGFNISSFYNEPVAYDVNMRVFETLSCGIPLLTNRIPSLERLFGPNGEDFLFTYDAPHEIVSKLKEIIARDDLQTLGQHARAWIERYGTYEWRMTQALDTLRVNGVIK